MLIRWYEEIIPYNFDIKHCPGIKHVLPDALSRLYPSYALKDSANTEPITLFNILETISSLTSQQLDKEGTDIEPTIRLMTEDEQSSYMLNKVVFRQLDRILGPFSIDLFADERNAQLHRYCSRDSVPKPKTTKVCLGDCFALDWSKELGYANPPWFLIPDIIQKVKSEKATIVVIAPVWPEKEWFKELLELADKPPLLLKHTRSLFLPKATDYKSGIGIPSWGATLAWHVTGKEFNLTSQCKAEISAAVEDAINIAQQFKAQPAHKNYTTEMKEDILTKVHLMGHFSTKYMVRLLKEQGHNWPRMYRDCELFQSACAQCNRFNSSKSKYHPVTPIQATLPFDHVIMDLHTMSVGSKEHVYIFVLIDVCTRFIWLRPLKDKKGITIAKTLWDIMSDFGFPKVIQSDNGTEFVNSVVKSLCKLSCIDQRLISAYHPRADGIVERVMRDIVSMACKMLNGAKTDWYYLVPQIQLYMNLKVSTYHGFTPFSAMFSRPFVGFRDHSKAMLNEMTAEQIKDRYNQIQNEIFPRIAVSASEVAMKRKRTLDSKSTSLSDPFPDGSLVMVKDLTRKSKLDPRYFGPFVVLNRTRGGTYVLKDMTGELFHRNVPPSQLKLVSGETDNTPQQEYVVEAIVNHRGYPNNYEYRIKWEGYPASQNTWEPNSNLTNCQEKIDHYWKLRKKDRGF